MLREGFLLEIEMYNSTNGNSYNVYNSVVSQLFTELLINRRAGNSRTLKYLKSATVLEKCNSIKKERVSRKNCKACLRNVIKIP